jgi:hypothetical protein
MVISVQLMAAFAITSFAGWLMLKQGVGMHLLERRPIRCRRCGGMPRRTCTCKRD